MKKKLLCFIYIYLMISTAHAVLPGDCDNILSGTIQFQQFQNELNSTTKDLNKDGNYKICLQARTKVIISNDPTLTNKGFEIARNKIEIYTENLESAVFLDQRVGYRPGNSVFFITKNSYGFKISDVIIELSVNSDSANGILVKDASVDLIKNVSFKMLGRNQSAINVVSTYPEAYTSKINTIESSSFFLSDSSTAYNSINTTNIGSFINNKAYLPAGSKTRAYSFTSTNIDIINNLYQENGSGLSIYRSKINEINGVTLRSIYHTPISVTDSRIVIMNNVSIVNPVLFTTPITVYNARISVVRNVNYTGTIVPLGNRVFTALNFTGIYAENLKVNGVCGDYFNYPTSFYEVIKCR